MSRKLIVVTSATGTQGTSILRTFLTPPYAGKYRLRGLTRNPASPASKEWEGRGVEMVRADLGDKPSLVRAFEGAYAVFGNTVPSREVDDETQGRNMVDASLANHVPLFVWSSIPSAKEISGGKYTDVTHWEQKHAVDEYIAQVNQPAVILWMGGFLDNLVTQAHRLHPSPSTPDQWVLSSALVPAEVKMSSIYIRGDLGQVVGRVVEKWEDEGWRARLGEGPIPVAGLRASVADMGRAIERVTGKKVLVVETTAAPPGLPPHLISMFRLFADGMYDFPGLNPPEILLDLGVQFHTLDEFVREEVVGFMAAQEKQA